MNVRVVTIAAEFPAREELLALIGAYAEAWPSTRTNVEREMKALNAKTRAHLQMRGLFSY